MKHLLTYALIALISLTACTNGKKGETTDNAGAQDTLVTEQMADSTIYGTSDEFGMSTFTIISDQGDTLYLTRTAEDGTDGKIYGDLNEGERYAVTTRDNKQAIDVLINLTQLERHTKDFMISNGNLIVDNDTVEIDILTDKELKFK